MKKLNRRWMVAMAVGVTFASLGLKANGTLIDLGERDLATRLSGQPAARAYIETSEGLPPGTLTFLNAFDADGTFSNNGAVDGSHFGCTMTDGGVNGLVSWDLATSGFQLSYVFIKDGAGSRTGPFLYHLYGVSPDEFFNSMGDQFVTVNGIRDITYIAFYGVPGSPAPEGGMTAILLALGLGAVELTRRFRLRRSQAA